MRSVPAARELPDALRLSGLQVPVGLGGKSGRYIPVSVGRISRLAAHPANAAGGGTNVAPPPLPLVTPLPRRDAPSGAQQQAARMEAAGRNPGNSGEATAPDSAMLHPGYGATCVPIPKD